jgi:hypothetical protein
MGAIFVLIIADSAMEKRACTCAKVFRIAANLAFGIGFDGAKSPVY